MGIINMETDNFKLNHYYRNIKTPICGQYYLKLINITTHKYSVTKTYMCINPSPEQPSIQYGMDDWLWQNDVDYEEIDEATFKDALITAKNNIEKILNIKF